MPKIIWANFLGPLGTCKSQSYGCQGKKQKTDAMEVDEGPKEQESEANVQPPKKVDEPKAETQAEAKSEPKVSPKVDEPKVEPKVAEPQVEPKVDEPKVEPKVDEQKVEPKVDEPKVDPKVDEPKVDPKAKAGEMAEAKVEPRTESEAKDVEMNEEEKTSMPLQPHQGCLAVGLAVNLSQLKVQKPSFTMAGSITKRVTSCMISTIRLTRIFAHDIMIVLFCMFLPFDPAHMITFVMILVLANLILFESDHQTGQTVPFTQAVTALVPGSHYHQRRLAEKAQELKLEDEGGDSWWQLWGWKNGFGGTTL